MGDAAVKEHYFPFGMNIGGFFNDLKSFPQEAILNDDYKGVFNSSHNTRKIQLDTMVELDFWESVFGVIKTLEISYLKNNKNASKIVGIRIPPGTHTDAIIEVKDDEFNIACRVRVQKNPTFYHNGIDVFSTIQIPYTTASLGGEIDVNHWNTKYTIKIPKGILRASTGTART